MYHPVAMPPPLSFPQAARFAAIALVAHLAGPVSLLAAPPAKSAPWFTDVTKASGLETTARPVPYDSFELPDILSPGVALHDFDGDGDLDLYFTNDAPNLGRPRSAKAPHNHYFRNDAGRFTDVTVASGLAHAGYGFGVAVGDIDNDGDLDLFAANFDRDFLFRNRGNGVFDNVSTGLRIAKDGWSASAAFVDYDGDGFLDLTVNQYASYDSTRACRDLSGRPDFCGPKDFPPLSELLLHNRGDGTFDDVTAAAGLLGAKGAGLGVICEDFDLDGKQDLYVANDGYSNNLWMNRGRTKFVDEALLLGCALNSQGIAEAGMGVVAFDFDADLDLDIFITHLRNETNTLFKNLGSHLGFDDATAISGLGPPSLPYTGFGTAAFDVEHDGDIDLFVANGAVLRGKTYEGCRLGEPWKSFAEPNHFYLNDGAGKFNLLGAAESGPILTDVELSRGTAGGDLDGDGDFDLVVANLASPHRIYRNDAPRRGSWLVVRTVDPKTKRDAIGATVVVKCGAKRHLRSISSSWSYLSSSEPWAHFGLGPAKSVDSIHVRWPDGVRERFTGGAVDRRVTVERGKGTTES